MLWGGNECWNAPLLLGRLIGRDLKRKRWLSSWKTHTVRLLHMYPKNTTNCCCVSGEKGLLHTTLHRGDGKCPSKWKRRMQSAVEKYPTLNLDFETGLQRVKIAVLLAFLYCTWRKEGEVA